MISTSPRHQSTLSACGSPWGEFRLPVAKQNHPMPMPININTAGTKELTQLPGIAKNMAYRIVSHRSRHGWFVHWGELAEVKEFPVHKLDAIKQRATLDMPDHETASSPRRLTPDHLARDGKKP